jgi:putative tryptophan/tyrosine transport system substrate-binding protein
MRRRDFVTLLGGAAVALPLAAWAQTPDVTKRIGVLSPYPESDKAIQAQLALFRSALEQLGWSEGHNLRIDYRWAGGDMDRLAPLARELVALRPNALLVRATPGAVAAMRATRTIPIVFVVVSDPVGDGLVASIAHPGGNVTGFTNGLEQSIGGKWIEILREIAPSVTRFGIMYNPRTAPGGGAYYMDLIKRAADTLQVRTIPTLIENADGIDAAFQTLAREADGGLLVVPDATTTANRAQIVALAARLRVPAIYPFRFFAEEGGLVSYGIEVGDVYRQAAAYIDRILRGATPAELPVQAPTKFDLVINLKTAKVLGITVPLIMQMTADAVIE